MFKYLKFLDLIRSNVPITIKNNRAFEALQLEIFILGAIAMMIAIIISYIVANAVTFEGGANPKDAKKRKTYFWLIGVSFTILYILYNLFLVSRMVAPNLQDNFLFVVIGGAVGIMILYWFIGFVLSRFILTKNKYGTIFPSKKA